MLRRACSVWIWCVRSSHVRRSLPAFHRTAHTHTHTHTHTDRYTQILHTNLHLISTRPSYGQKCIKYKGSLMWNSLHLLLRFCSSISAFKTYVKNYSWAAWDVIFWRYYYFYSNLTILTYYQYYMDTLFEINYYRACVSLVVSSRLSLCDCLRAFDRYQNRWPWVTLNVTSHNMPDFGSKWVKSTEARSILSATKCSP